MVSILSTGSDSKSKVVYLLERIPCANPEGGQGVRSPPPPPLKNHKNIGFLSNCGPDTLKNHKATKPAFVFGSLSAYRWWIDDGPPIVVFVWILFRSLKNVVKVGPPLKKLSGSAHATYNKIMKKRVCTISSTSICHLTFYVISVLFLLCFRARLFIDALWSPVGKGLTL